MKKIVLLITFVIVSVSSYAQITNSFWGLTLGNSSKQQVINYLNQNRISYETMPDGSLAYSPDNLPYGGGYWTYIDFSFYNNTLYQVWFQNNSSEIPVDNMYDYLRSRLIEKYNDFLFLDEDPNNKSIHFIDRNGTRVSLGFTQNRGTKYISLSYTNERIEEAKQKEADSEL